MCEIGIQVVTPRLPDLVAFFPLCLSMQGNVTTHGTHGALRIKAFIEWHTLPDIYAQFL